MATRLSNACIVDSNPYANPGAQPGRSSIGGYDWSVAGESADGTILIVQTSAAASSPVASGNTVTATEARGSGNGSFIQVNVSYSDRSNKDNWTVNAGGTGGNLTRFQKGNGGGH